MENLRAQGDARQFVYLHVCFYVYGLVIF
jgi:hypothetical protein